MFANNPFGVRFFFTKSILKRFSNSQVLGDFISSCFAFLDIHLHHKLIQTILPNVLVLNCQYHHTFPPQANFARFKETHTHYSRFTPIFTPLSALYLDFTFDSTEPVLVLAIRGSSSIHDWLVDLHFCDTVVDSIEIVGTEQHLDCNRVNSRVHLGIYAAAAELFQRTKDHVQYLMDSKGIEQLVVTGHSLGGGIATYLTEMYRDEFESNLNAVVKGFAFAPPPTYSIDPDIPVQSFIYWVWFCFVQVGQR